MERSENTLLEMNHIGKTFPGVKALNNVRFSLKSGEVHALVGENGAGKSTLIKILMGIESKDCGEILIHGHPINIRNPQHAGQNGISAVFQELSQIPYLTVAENVFLNRECTYGKTIIRKSRIVEETNKIIRKYNIELDAEAPLYLLSTAQRQLAEIVKAIAFKPDILIMDEPTSSLTHSESEILFSIIEDFKKSGSGIIYISHRMNEIFKLADRITILRDGCFISENCKEELDIDKIVKLMVGRDVELYKKEKVSVDSLVSDIQVPAMEVKNLCKHNKFSNVSFTLKKGEILGVAGLVGSGRTELMNILFGVDKADSGQIIVDGKPIKISSVKDALQNGIAMIPENRHMQGLVLLHSIEQNLSLSVINKFSKCGFLNHKAIERFVAEKVIQYNIKTESGKKAVNSLSGGNQQKVVIAKWLCTNPKILIVDEPTVGIDVHSKAEIHRLIRSLAEKGLSVIMVSSEMTELLAHSDRIIIMNNNRIVGILTDADQEKIMSMIMKDKMINNKQ